MTIKTDEKRGLVCTEGAPGKILRTSSVAPKLAPRAGLNAEERLELNRKLFVATNKNDENAVKRLLKAGADANARNDQGETALRKARKVEVAELLIANGADVDAKDCFGETALMWSSFHGYKQVVELLLARGADVNARNHDGRTALMFASHGGQTEVVKVLVDAGADVNAIDEKGRTALKFAHALRFASFYGSRSVEISIEIMEILRNAGAKGSAFE